MNKRVFVCTDFTGRWPVGSAAVMLADDESEARRYLDNALTARGLKQRVDTLTLKELEMYGCEVLCDGDY